MNSRRSSRFAECAGCALGLLLVLAGLAPPAAGQSAKSTVLPRWPCHAVDTGAAQSCAPSQNVPLARLPSARPTAGNTCGQQQQPGGDAGGGGSNASVCYVRATLAVDSAFFALRHRARCTGHFCCFPCDDGSYRRHDAALAVDGNAASFWLSDALPSPGRAVEFRLDLPSDVLLAGVRVRFALSRPSALRLQVGDDSDSSKGASWRTLQYYADSCVKRYSQQPGSDTCTEFGAAGLDVELRFPGQDPLAKGKQALIAIPAETRQRLVIRRLRLVLDRAADIPIEELDALQAMMNSGRSPGAVAKFWHYSIAELHVAGLCFCNGHAERCDMGTGACVCEHNTAGVHCDKCKDLYNDKPWIRATNTDAGVCKACTCNNHTEHCRFDAELFRSGGNRSGGACQSCRDHTRGTYCQECKELFYRQPHVKFTHREACLPCGCNPYGVLQNTSGCHLATGQCACAGGYSGRQCEQCDIALHYTAPAYHHSGAEASVCKPCRCHGDGALTPHCDGDGWCACKAGVGGLRCDQCKEGFFNLTETGCRKCNCDPRGSAGCSGNSGACFCKPNVGGERCTDCVGGSRYIGEEAVVGCITPNNMVPSHGLDIKYMAILAVTIVAVTLVIALGIFCIVRHRAKRRSEGRLVRFASERVLAQSRPMDNYVSDGPCLDSPSAVAQRQVSDCTIFENPLRSDESTKHDSGGDRPPPFMSRRSAPAIMPFSDDCGGGGKELRDELARRNSTPEIAMFLNEAFGQDDSDGDSAVAVVPLEHEGTASQQQQRRSRIFSPRRADLDAASPTGAFTAAAAPRPPAVMYHVKPAMLPLNSPEKAATSSPVKRAQSFNAPKRVPPPKPARSPMRCHSLRPSGSMPQLAHAQLHGRRPAPPPPPPGAPPAVPVPKRKESLHASDGNATSERAAAAAQRVNGSSRPLHAAQHYTSAPLLPLAPLRSRGKPQHPPPVIVRRRQLPKVTGRSSASLSADPRLQRASKTGKWSPSPLSDQPVAAMRARSCTTPDQLGTTGTRRSSATAPAPRPTRRRRTPRRARSNSLTALNGLYSEVPRKKSSLRCESWARGGHAPGAGCEDCSRVDMMRKARSCQLSADSYDGNWEDSDDDEDAMPAVPDRTQASYQLYATAGGTVLDADRARPAQRARAALPEPVDPCDGQFNPYESLKRNVEPLNGDGMASAVSAAARLDHPYETLRLHQQMPYTSLITMPGSGVVAKTM